MLTSPSPLAEALAHPLGDECADCREIQRAGPQLGRPAHVGLITESDARREAATVAALEAERKPAAERRRDNRAASRTARAQRLIRGQFAPVRRSRATT